MKEMMFVAFGIVYTAGLFLVIWLAAKAYDWALEAVVRAFRLTSAVIDYIENRDSYKAWKKQRREAVSQ